MSITVSIHGYTVTKNQRTRARKRIQRPGLDPKSPKQLAAAVSTNKQLANLAEKRLNGGYMPPVSTLPHLT